MNLRGLFSWLAPKDDKPRTLDPPGPAPRPGQAPPDPLGLPDFLARMRIGDREPLTPAHFAAAARRLGVPTPVLQAVVQVESGGAPAFGPDNLPTIRFEPHVFSALTNAQFDAAHPDVSYPDWDSRKYPRSQDVIWRQLARAFALDGEHALQATCWGLFQLLGVNFAACGFPTAAAFAASIAGSAGRQLEAFEAFIAGADLAPLLKAKRWAEFAAAYTGEPDAPARGRQMERAYKALVKKQPR